MGDGLHQKEKKSWSELKNASCELRRQLSELSTFIPSLVKFRTLLGGNVRIFFLGPVSNGGETTLHYVDVPSRDYSKKGKLQWLPLLEYTFQMTILGHLISREEQLILERKRLTNWGITFYELHQSSGKIVFPAGGTLYQCVDKWPTNGPRLFPSEVRTNSSGAKLAPEICPTNPDLIAYLCNCDIWVAHEPSGCSMRVTFAHKGGRSLADDPLSAGRPSYVIQEEFLRYEGFWWQPFSKKQKNVYRLLYEEVDDSKVVLLTFPSFATTNPDAEQYRFPRAGTPNSESYLKLIELVMEDSLQGIKCVRTLEMKLTLKEMFPWMDYLVRVGWTPDAEHIWLQLLNRRQNRLELVVLSLDVFIEPVHNVFHPEEPCETSSALPLVLLTQNSDVWVNSQPDGQMSFIWGSEETGYRHLYYIKTSQPSSATNGVNSHDGNEIRCKIDQKVPLTSGDWEVLSYGMSVDPVRRLVYFMGLKDTPLEKHLYVVSLDKPDYIRRLTLPGYSFSVNINEECTIAVAVYSNIKWLPSCEVFRINHTDETVDGVVLDSVGYLCYPEAPDTPLHCRELYSHRISSGDLLYAMVFRPHNFQEGKKYPTVLSIYGGPEVQLVSNSFEGMKHLRMHILASQGYCVVAIDSRGSQHRGLAFESHLKNRMGTVELLDQIEVLEWLASELDFIDMQRVGILGWSYGGYLSLMALAQFPNIFKVAIAGAPVTTWMLYDTGYTERYMDLPDKNPQGYNTGSILSYIDQFPDEENRLLIIHGLIDDNVSFTHTSLLINQLIRKGKPYQLQIYPNERHSLRSLYASKHYETMVLSFLQDNL